MNNGLKMETRKTQRKATRVMAKVKYGLQEIQGRVLNLSTNGIALELAGPLHAGIGSQIKIYGDDIGHLEGLVRWCHRGRLGIQFNSNSSARAQVGSYFRFFHKDVRPAGSPRI